MLKSMLIILVLLFTVGCGEKKIEPTPKVKEVANSTTSVVENGVVSIESNKEVIEEVIPAHIANSTIEVVVH